MAQSLFLTWYLRHKLSLEVALLTVFFVINILANGYVAHIENLGTRVMWWMPWLWEISSGLVVALLFPLLRLYTESQPLRLGEFRLQFFLHLLCSILFCCVHLIGMVVIRNYVYYMNGLNYNFDWGWQVVSYEYAKDLRVYLFFVVLLEFYRFVIRRWRGEVSVLSVAPDCPAQPAEHYLQQVLVKMLNQEFLIKLSQVNYIKSAGNYQEFYVAGRAYPLRITQSNLLAKLDPAVFIKVSRGMIINLNSVVRFIRVKGGDAELLMDDNSLLSVHRNYVASLPESLRVVAPGSTTT